MSIDCLFTPIALTSRQSEINISNNNESLHVNLGSDVCWLRHYAISRKIAGWVPDEVIGFFNLPNPSSRTMALRVDSASNRNEYQGSSWG
jgi:hypothetical protein